MLHTFKRFIHTVTRGLPFCFAYIDYLLVCSREGEQHIQHLGQVFHHLVEYGRVINRAKCQFGAPELDFIGCRIDKDAIRPLPLKVQAIQDFPQSSSIRKLRELLGLVNFYNCFIPNCAAFLRPLTHMPHVVPRSTKRS